MTRFQSPGRRHALLFGALVTFSLLAFGAYLTLIQAPRQERERRRIAAYPELNRDRYTDVLSGEWVVLTGRLEENPTLTRYELVAYQRDEWQVSTEDDGDQKGSWRTLELRVPPLVLVTRGGEVRTVGVVGVTMSGDLHEFIEPSERGDQADYEGRPLSEGSNRVLGVRNRDVVTVVGLKTTAGDLRPERVHGGDRASLVEDLRADIQVLRIVGGVMIVVGAGGLLLVGVLGWRYGLLRFQ